MVTSVITGVLAQFTPHTGRIFPTYNKVDVGFSLDSGSTNHHYCISGTGVTRDAPLSPRWVAATFINSNSSPVLLGVFKQGSGVGSIRVFQCLGGDSRKHTLHQHTYLSVSAWSSFLCCYYTSTISAFWHTVHEGFRYLGSRGALVSLSIFVCFSFFCLQDDLQGALSWRLMFGRASREFEGHEVQCFPLYDFDAVLEVYEDVG
jgi:hypothetical protein